MSRGREFLVILVTLICVTAVYWPPRFREGQSYAAMDFAQLHQRRMAFARKALLGPSHTLPAWYPRELLGTPFWSNPQNFPFLPTRLLVLFAFDPFNPYAYATAILIAANLSALFAFLFMRKTGIGLLGTCAGAWTFACSGFFASRIMPGHLPLLEVYCTLPLLLWLIESLQAARRDRAPRAPQRRWIVALGLASACAMLAGHPQLSIYSIGASLAYAVWRGWIAAPKPRRAGNAIVPIVSIVLGIGCASFVLIPMSLLIGRSTRVVALAQPKNDVEFLYSMIPTWWLPWFNGKAVGADKAGNPFRLPDEAYFWDGIAYTGWAPWVAIVALIVIALLSRRKLGAVATFILLLGVAGMLFALPFWRPLRDALPGVILRSPARLIYLTEFALAFALAAGVDAIIRASRANRAIVGLIVVGLLVHAIDLARFDRIFIRPATDNPSPTPESWAEFVRYVGDGRVGIDRNIIMPENRTLDDVGFFDSIMLARSYRFIMNLGANKPDANLQGASGVEFATPALQRAGVRYIVTARTRGRLISIGQLGIYNLYAVPDPAPRAQFFPARAVSFRTGNQIQLALRSGEVGANRMLLPFEAKPSNFTLPAPAPETSQTTNVVDYRRPDTDHIECKVTAHDAGYLRVIESFDPGWQATIDNQSAPIVPADDALLAVRVEPGQHMVRFEYRTPGARAGVIVALISLVAMITLALLVPARRASANPPPALA